MGCKNQCISANMDLAKMHKNERENKGFIRKTHETNIIVRNSGIVVMNHIIHVHLISISLWKGNRVNVKYGF